jgi:hypothetical protein
MLYSSVILVINSLIMQIIIELILNKDIYKYQL